MPNDLGVVVEVEGRRLHVFNIHNTDYPYQPYQLLGIPYGDQPSLACSACCTLPGCSLFIVTVGVHAHCEEKDVIHERRFIPCECSSSFPLFYDDVLLCAVRVRSDAIGGGRGVAIIILLLVLARLEFSI